MNTTRNVPRLLPIMLLLVIASCAPVRLLESNDPKIEEGMSEYQEALEGFVQRTLLNYERCKLNRAEMARLARMICEDGSAEVRELCEAEVLADRERMGRAVEKTCTAASYDGTRESFYIPQETRLSVLKTRAAVLDSTGVCAAAMKGVTKLVDSVVPGEVRGAIGDFQEGESANCTEIVVTTVLDNHRALGEGHARIDEIDAEGGDAATQAGAFLPLQRDTLVQNVSIVLFLERAKKRGDEAP